MGDCIVSGNVQFFLGKLQLADFQTDTECKLWEILNHRWTLLLFARSDSASPKPG